MDDQQLAGRLVDVLRCTYDSHTELNPGVASLPAGYTNTQRS